MTDEMVVSSIIEELMHLYAPPRDADAMAREFIETINALGLKLVRHNEIDDINTRFNIITKGIGRC